MSAKASTPTTATQFLNGPNYQKIVGFLRQHYTQKLGQSVIPQRMDERLQKTVQHYMTEISRVQGPGKPLNMLNNEVVKQTTANIDGWLKRQDTAPPPATTSVGAFARPDEYNRLFEDTSTRYENMMTERMPPTQAVPAVPDFRQTTNDILDSNEDPVILMQRMQAERESQARALGLAGPPPVATPPRLDIVEEPAPSASNPVAPQADTAPPLLAPRPQDYIIPQEDILKYRETELNLFITSADRDWLRNTSENRYNFTVNFNTGTKKIGYGYNGAIQTRLRNIQRIEFVKAIVPIESFTPLVRVMSAGAPPSSGNPGDPYVTPPTYDVTRVINIFSLPFVGIRIDELEPNGYSTKPEEDATFAIVQYDTTWSSDLYSLDNINATANSICTKSGYSGLIPKFLKTQRVYTPTPLATLQKLSINMQRHNGSTLSTDPDVWSIQRICMSDCLTAIGDMINTQYKIITPKNSYIFIQTKNYFPFSAIGEGDNIQIQGYASGGATPSNAAIDFNSFINQSTANCNPSAGFYVVATGYVEDEMGCMAINDGRNSAGYCNLIILRNRFDDPSTGMVERTNSYFGGNTGAEDALTTALCSEAPQTGAALINLSRQTHVVLRVVTRDMDSASKLRPDNV